MRTFSSNDDNKEFRKEKRGQLWVNEKQMSLTENEKNNIKWSDEIKGVGH